MLTLPPVEEVQEYEGDGYAMVVDGTGADVFEAHDRRSRLVKALPPGAVVRAIGEAGSQGKVAYYNVVTRSGTVGWCKRWDLDPVTDDEAELLVLRDNQSFEQSLLDTIDTAARLHIETKGIHSMSHVQEVQITNEVTPEASGSSFDIGVQVLMVGSILGMDKYQVDLTVNLLIYINRDHLTDCTIEVNRVTVTDDRQVAGMTPAQQIGLLKVIAPLIGILVP